MSIVNKIIGSRKEKREYKAIKARAKKLPKSYANAYDAMGKYLNVCGGLTSWDDFKRVYTCILDLLEEGASYNIKVSDLVGDDASVFCDDLVRNSKTWQDKYRKRLNKKINIHNDYQPSNYEGISSQSIKDAILSCKKTIMPSRLIDAIEEAHRLGLLYGNDYKEVKTTLKKNM